MVFFSPLLWLLCDHYIIFDNGIFVPISCGWAAHLNSPIFEHLIVSHFSLL